MKSININEGNSHNDSYASYHVLWENWIIDWLYTDLMLLFQGYFSSVCFINRNWYVEKINISF